MTTPYRILLVEDSRTQAIQFANTCEPQGWQVEIAQTADLAMQRLNSSPPDLIVIDHHLPGMRGDELCRMIRMNINTRNIPLMMFTMDDTYSAELRGLDSGADDFLPKTVDSEVLLARVRTLLTKSPTRPCIFGHGSQEFRRVRLLTIDDSPTYQEFLTRELSKEGYLVETALSSVEGLMCLQKGNYDCALVDLVMPDVDGIELCRRISALRERSASPVAVLMLTGRETKEDLTQALEAGADDFVGKSSDLAVLKGRIRALLRRKFFQDENRRIADELKYKELEMLRARNEKEIAEAKAALNGELERRVAERTAELAEANRCLAQKSQENEMFVYSVSHDLRSPLVNLQGFSQELSLACQEVRGILADNQLPNDVKERGLALLDGDVGQYLAYIQTAVMRLGSIIDALLRLSRAGRVEYRHQDVDVESVVARILKAMSATIAKRTVRIEVGSLPRAWGDSTALEQVFANLIGNALNYLSADRAGVIEIGSEQVTSGDASQPEAEMVTYFVRDNGLGIEREYLPKLFHAFKRLHPDVAQGEGMGLAIVQRVVERHGGRIWAESEVGKGTTFYVSLPSYKCSDTAVADNCISRELIGGAVG